MTTKEKFMKKLFFWTLALQTLLINAGIYAEDGTDPAAPSRDQGMSQTLIMIAIALIFFYLILWRPEQKRRKEMEEQRASIKKGDRVTAMGIIGTVVRIQENTIILRMVDGSKIEFLKAAISDVVPGTEDDVKKAEKDDLSLEKNSTDKKV
jgi:preprotein translocase subunit YajC